MKNLLRSMPAGILLASSVAAALTIGPTTQPTGVDPTPAVNAVNQLAASANATITAQAQQHAADQATIQQMQSAVRVQVQPRELGVNLESIDFTSRGLYFADAMLQSQNFYTGADASGNPTVDQGIILMGGMTASEAGDYTLVCTGQGNFALQASLGTLHDQAYNAATNTTTATLTVTSDQINATIAQWGPSTAQIGIKISNVVAGKVSNVQCWRPGAMPGQRYYAPFLKILAPFDTIRFMPFLAGNGKGQTQINPQKEWADRPLPTDRNYTSPKGGCYEDCFGLAKAAGKIPWINVPLQASPDYLKNLIALCQQQGGPVYIAWGNELWAWTPAQQWAWILAQSQADPRLRYDGQTDPNILAWRWIGQRAVDIGQAACAAYGVSDIRKCPVRPVLEGQWGNPQVLQYATAYINARYGPVRKLVHSFAIAPYATLSPAIQARVNSGDTTLTEQQIVADFQAGGIANASLANAGTAAFVQLCQANGVPGRAYEFGYDDGQGAAARAIKIAANHDPAIGAVTTAYLANWYAAGCVGLNWHTLTCADGQSGDWGLTTDCLNPMNDPKYVAASAAAMNLLP